MTNHEAKIEQLQRLILDASREAYPDDLVSAPGGELLRQAARITGDRPYPFGGQQLFYDALSRLAERNLIDVNRGTGGAFIARLTDDGVRVVSAST